jgi:Tfp pilus assembly protein PilF
VTKNRKSRRPGRTQKPGKSTAVLERWLQLALLAEQRGALEEALGLYLKIVAKDPGQAAVWHALGGLYYQKNDHERAIEALEHAHHAAPGNMDYLSDLGGLYLAAGRFDRAESIFRDALNIQHDFSPALYNLSGALYRQGKLIEAIAALRKLLSFEPGFPEAHFNLGVALRETGNARGALESFTRARTLQPDNARVDLELAHLHTDTHYLDEAITAFKAYLLKVPHDAEAVIVYEAWRQQGFADGR